MQKGGLHVACGGREAPGWVQAWSGAEGAEGRSGAVGAKESAWRGR